ncbi:hypothetical protein PV326_006475, partial [Microctonus aethiopoides]
ASARRRLAAWRRGGSFRMQHEPRVSLHQREAEDEDEEVPTSISKKLSKRSTSASSSAAASSLLLLFLSSSSAAATTTTTSTITGITASTTNVHTNVEDDVGIVIVVAAAAAAVLVTNYCVIHQLLSIKYCHPYLITTLNQENDIILIVRQTATLGQSLIGCFDDAARILHTLQQQQQQQNATTLFLSLLPAARRQQQKTRVSGDRRSEVAVFDNYNNKKRIHIDNKKRLLLSIVDRSTLDIINERRQSRRGWDASVPSYVLMLLVHQPRITGSPSSTTKTKSKFINFNNIIYNKNNKINNNINIDDKYNINSKNNNIININNNKVIIIFVVVGSSSLLLRNNIAIITVQTSILRGSSSLFYFHWHATRIINALLRRGLLSDGTVDFTLFKNNYYCIDNDNDDNESDHSTAFNVITRDCIKKFNSNNNNNNNRSSNNLSKKYNCSIDKIVENFNNIRRTTIKFISLHFSLYQYNLAVSPTDLLDNTAFNNYNDDIEDNDDNEDKTTTIIATTAKTKTKTTLVSQRKLRRDKKYRTNERLFVNDVNPNNNDDDGDDDDDDDGDYDNDKNTARFGESTKRKMENYNDMDNVSMYKIPSRRKRFINTSWPRSGNKFIGQNYNIFFFIYLMALPLLCSTDPSTGAFAAASAISQKSSYSSHINTSVNLIERNATIISQRLRSVDYHHHHHHHKEEEEEEEKENKGQHQQKDNEHPYNEYTWEVNQINPWLSACDLAGPAPADLQGSCGPPEVPKYCPMPCINQNDVNNIFRQVVERLDIPIEWRTGAAANIGKLKKSSSISSSSSSKLLLSSGMAPDQCLFYLEESHKHHICREDFALSSPLSFLTPKENRYWFVSGLRLRHCCEHAAINALAPGIGGPLEDVLNGNHKCIEALDKLLIVDALAARLHSLIPMDQIDLVHKKQTPSQSRALSLKAMLTKSYRPVK